MKTYKLETQEQILELAGAFQQSRVLLTAFELGIFNMLGNKKMPSRTIADKLNADERGIDRLMNALTVLGLLEKQDGQFWNTPLAADCLVEGGTNYCGGLGHTANLWKTWSKLTEAVILGSCPPREPVSERGSAWLSDFIAAMHANGSKKAPEVIKLLNLKKVNKALDVGGGSGAYSIAMVNEKPDIRAVVYDLPNVTPLTQSYIDSAGLSDKITTIDGDFEQDELGEGYDMIFMSNIIHSNGDSINRELMRKAFKALNPGGQVVIQEFVPNEERTAPPFAIFFALNMLTGTPEGDTFTVSEMTDWLTSAGFVGIIAKETPHEAMVIIAEKPV